MQLQELLKKTCVLGLSYYNLSGELLKQVQHAGTVVAIDPEQGISIRLHPRTASPAGGADDSSADHVDNTDRHAEPRFTLPATLLGWFKAPAGDYRDVNGQLLATNPDYLVTWDIYQTREKTPEGEHEWWEWQPRTAPPAVG